MTEWGGVAILGLVAGCFPHFLPPGFAWGLLLVILSLKQKVNRCLSFGCIDKKTKKNVALSFLTLYTCIEVVQSGLSWYLVGSGGK